MNFLFDVTTTQDQFANRGIGVYTKQLITNLIKLSVSNKSLDKYSFLMFDAPSTLDDLIMEYPEVVTVVNLGKRRLSDKLNSIWWMKQFAPAINEISTQQDFDFYFCPYFWRGFPTNASFKTAVMIHDLAFAVQGKYSRNGGFFDKVRKFQYHHALDQVAKADLVFTNSKHTKNDFLKYVNYDQSKVSSVHLGVSENISPIKPDIKVLDKYIKDESIEDGYILYYGGVEPNKNVPALVRAYIKLVEAWDSSVSNVESNNKAKLLPYLVLAGSDFVKPLDSNPQLVEIHRLIDAANIESKVIYTGFYEDSDLNHLLGGARLFIHLSNYEGFGFSPLEAMKAGIPTVASNRSCYPEVLGDGAQLVDPDLPNNVAKVMLDLLLNKEKARDLVARGIEKANSYSWEKTAKNTYEILNKYGKSEK